MKLLINWRLALAVLAVFSLGSCSDDNDTFNSSNLGGTWQKVYDSGVADAGIVRNTFEPQSSVEGKVTIFTSDWAAGDTTIFRNYVVGYTGHMIIFEGKSQLDRGEKYSFDIHKLSSTQMIWYHTDTNEELARFKRVN